VVNTVNVAQQLKIDLTGVGNLAKEATFEQLTGDPDVQNTVAEPTKIAPTTGKIEDAGASFTHEFPGNSVTVIRLSPAK
jgi:alpha-L-arabinofuranosidase